MSADWLEFMVLFMLRIVEYCTLCYFLSPLEKRKHGFRIAGLQVIGFAAISVIIRTLIYQFNWESEFVFITFAYYPIILAFIMTRYITPLKEGIYFILLYFLSIHSLRFLLMRISTSIYGINVLVNGSNPFKTILFLALFAACLLFEFAVLKKYAYRYPKYKLTWPQLGLTIIATIPVIYITNLFLILNIESSDLPISLIIIGVVCCICGMMIVIGYKYSIALARNKQEMVALEGLLASQTKQYQLKKETIEIINARYHDLKKHINFLASIDSQKEREKYLESFKLQASVFEAFHDTGNETLDIVLNDKDMECRKNGIRLLPFIDGNELLFLQPLDIVTIFDNAIENGIEAVKQLPDDSRVITIRMHKKDNWLVLTFENSFSGTVSWQDRRLATTKGNSIDHGFGLINIEDTVRKYGGNVTVEAKDTQFILTILFQKS
ncbi:MAG: GHKL domain-containing protein [Anaerolineales bacterium]|nr:GHKL domain-containing protein [Anaerolineales bacterium]